MPSQLLVVDDTELNRDMLSRRLIRAGYEVACVEDGAGALRLIDKGGIALVLLDVMMPVMDGIAVLTELRRKYSMADLPVIMVTARTESDQIVEALQLGANDYVVKPINFPVVLARVKTQLTLKTSNDKIKSLAQELEQRNDFIRQTFGRYVSNQVVQTVLDNPDGLNFDGIHQELTVLFADLRGFTMLADTLPATMIVRLLNNYLEAMIEVVELHKGTVAEIVGDGLLAFFGAPVADPDHALNAVTCSIQMQLAMQAVNEKNSGEDLISLRMGIGINSGEGVLGNIGSLTRAKYAVVGSVVNFAARIETMTAGGQVFVADSTFQKVKELVRIDSIRTVTPKGSRESMEIHELVGLGNEDTLLRIDTEQLVYLKDPVPVTCAIANNKRIGDAKFEGRFQQLSLTSGILSTDENFEAYSELQFHFDDNYSDPLFGRAVRRANYNTEWLIRFSSLTPVIQTRISELIQTRP